MFIKHCLLDKSIDLLVNCLQTKPNRSIFWTLLDVIIEGYHSMLRSELVLVSGKLKHLIESEQVRIPRKIDFKIAYKSLY